MCVHYRYELFIYFLVVTIILMGLQVLLAKEESHVIIFRLFSSSIHTLDSIKHHIAHTFCNFFSKISNTDSMDRRYQFPIYIQSNTCIYLYLYRFYVFVSYILCILYVSDMFIYRQDELLPCYVRDIIATVGNQYRQRAKKWFSGKKDSCDKEDPELAFKILVAMLKGSLERLKAMRSASISDIVVE